MLSSYPHRLVKWLSGLVFPYRCLGCRNYLEKEYLCRDCLAAIPTRMRLECIGCRRTSPGGVTCPECRPQYAVGRIFIASEYHHPLVAEAVKALKYKFLPEVADSLVQLASTYIQNQSALHRISFASEDFLVVPTPLHACRLNWRGFNQAELLARGLAARYRLSYAEPISRMVYRAPQASVKEREARLEHTKNVFQCGDPLSVSGRNILVVDDVCTTGATLNECARVLKSAGAKSVSALVVARG